MGISLASAIIGMGMVVSGIALLILQKPRKVALSLMILGLALIVLPYSLIYIFFD